MNVQSVLFTEQRLPMVGTYEELITLIVKSINYSIGGHLISPFERILIGVAGGSGAGKSHLAERIAKELAEFEPAIISQERFHKESFSDINNPDNIDKDLYIKTLEQIKDYTTPAIKVSGFTGPSGSKTIDSIKCGKVAIIEGLFTLYPEYFSLLNLSVFIDAFESIRFQRRIGRDVELKGKTYASVQQDWSESILPTIIDILPFNGSLPI